MKWLSKVGRILLYTASVGIIILTIVGVYVFTVPVDVLQDWTLDIDKSEYQAGEKITVHNKVRKVRSVSGISKRYIVCNTPRGSTLRSPMPEGVADRPQQTVSTDVQLIIPDDLPNLPATCYVEIVVSYDIYTVRKHVETNRTQDFTVLPPKNQTKIKTPVTQNNDNEVVENAPENPTKGNASDRPLERSAPLPSSGSGSGSAVEEEPVTQPPTLLERVEGTVRGVLDTGDKLIKRIL